MTVVHLLRHGQVHNPDNVLYGRLPEFRLSTTGEAMAAAVATYLKDAGRDIATVTSSPLLRAQQTAAAVADAFGLTVATDDRLIEAGNVWEGERLTRMARFALRPSTWWRVRNPFRPSWGEPYAQQRDRMLAAVRDAAAGARGREAVLVSHQLPIWVARSAVEGRSLAHYPGKRECSLASLTSLSVEDDGAITGVEYREPAAHLVARP